MCFVLTTSDTAQLGLSISENLETKYVCIPENIKKICT